MKLLGLSKVASQYIGEIRAIFLQSFILGNQLQHQHGSFDCHSFYRLFQCERLLPLSYFGPSTFSRRLSGEGSSAFVAEDKVAMMYF